jgi:hypothetical protein
MSEHGNPVTTTSSTSSTTQVIHAAADLAILRPEAQVLTAQALKELDSRVKALDEMARLENRLRILENRKRSSEAIEDPLSQPSPYIPPSQRLLSDSSPRY